MEEDELAETRFLMIRADSLLSLAIYRGEGPQVPLWKSEADYVLGEIRKWLKEHK